ncbi:protein jtb-like [Plakobranchus ocellatus]|uniref:Protein jtb-like n=1 Tax=Plakobranchus ocellatus TaxID=259542 RepID=A0AAV4DZJ8_9GAST|nr:protein jtb-like [Plakobranchus ocellatus]
MFEFFTKKRVLALSGLIFFICFVYLILQSHFAYTRQLLKQEGEIREKAKKAASCESYTVVERCKRCPKKELRDLVKVCMETGYKQKIKCSDGKEEWNWCEISPAVEESDFWKFQLIMVLIGASSYAIVYLRQQKLDKILMDKIHKQIAAGV